MAVGALLPRAAARHRGADSGVVDEHVESRLGRQYLVREPPHLGQRGEVGAVGPSPVAQLAERVRDPLLAAPVHEHGRARLVGGAREGSPEAVRGPGDEHDLVVQELNKSTIRLIALITP
jgi:hypothetical protein